MNSTNLLASIFFTFIVSIMMPFNAFGIKCSSPFEVQIVSDLPSVEAASANEYGFGFIVPNERNTELLKPLLQAVDAGLYVTVGTERGFMSAALMGDQAKGLVLVDRTPQVVLFNRINVSLLSLAKTRGQYLFLRTEANFAELQKELKKSSQLSHADRELLSRADIWNWWVENVQKRVLWNDFHQPTAGVYSEGNYLFSDRLFSVVSQLAKNDRIYVFQDDIQSASLQSRLLEVSQQAGVKISVFDISNAWEEGYLGIQNTTRLVGELSPLMRESSNLIFTYQDREQPHNTSSESIFKYLSVRLGSLQSGGNLNFYLGSIMMKGSSSDVNSRPRRSRFDF